MPTHINHTEKETFYFVTFTCYKWLPLIGRTQLYDYFERWITQLAQRGAVMSAYVVMPNHVHLLVYVEKSCPGLNKVMGEAKRFMAYEIVKRLKIQNDHKTLKVLSAGVEEEERKKGKKHQVFRLSFDAKAVDEHEIPKVLDYIHGNPVSGKWELADDMVDYPYSSARYYEVGMPSNIPIRDYRCIGSESSSSDSEWE